VKNKQYINGRNACLESSKSIHSKYSVVAFVVVVVRAKTNDQDTLRQSKRRCTVLLLQSPGEKNAQESSGWHPATTLGHRCGRRDRKMAR
jgi:hypothetical protein